MLDRPTREPWPPDYRAELDTRLRRLLHFRRNPQLWDGAREYYRTRPAEFVAHWCVTYDPRLAGDANKPPTMPFVPFAKQRELIEFVYACLEARANGLVEKSRDMGATWVCVAISVHLFLHWPGASVSWGSKDAGLVDKLGDPNSILEKARIILRNLPVELLPIGFSLTDHMSIMRIVNPETGATIVGGAGDNIGRGGRSLIAFKDESAHYQHAEAIEAALMANALVQMDLSSVHGLGTVFQRRREAGVDWAPGQTPVRGRTNVMVMDWSSHPSKTPEWYETERSNKEREGLSHVFASEVDRNYSAAVQGTVIPAEWVKSAIDAHQRLALRNGGPWHSALDVADGGGDSNAQATRQGVVLRRLEEWGERDTGSTARRAIANVRDLAPLRLDYDCVGVGAGVKSEANRLDDEDRTPPGLRLVPWNAGDSPQDADKRVIPRDKDSPLWCDFVQNLKAQGWWLLRRRFEVTHQVVIGELSLSEVDQDELISIDSRIPLLWKLVKELSQPTMRQSTMLKLMIEKAPASTKSPNCADAVMMCYHPVRVATPVVVGAGVLAGARVPTRSRFGSGMRGRAR